MTDKADNDALIYELNNLPMVCKGSQFDGWLLSNPTLESIVAALRTPQPAPVVDELKLEWREGEPSKPWRGEWFIAETTFADRVVLTALPEEYTYDYKTADDTYIKADKIKRWMQFPDSQYVAPSAEATRPQPDETETRAEVVRLNGKLLDIKRRCLRHPDDTPEDDTRDKRIAYTIASEALKGTDHGRG